MQTRFNALPRSSSGELVLMFARLALLLLPAWLLFAAALLVPNRDNPLLWMGTLFQMLACLLAVASRGGLREPAGPTVIMLYVIGLSWLVLAGDQVDSGFLHLAQAILLVVPLVYFAVQTHYDSGAPALRRARQLAARMAARRDWPDDAMACRLLPEVKAFREALHIDASPALGLLSHPRAQVRVAALAALEFRPQWRPGQPDVVLGAARRAPEPEVRACAVMALANVDDRVLIESLAEFLHDPALLVRQYATQALLWNTDERWDWVRPAVRHALADPVCQDDGPLRPEGRPFSAEAVTDLTAWASEKGLLSLRASLTLAVHYSQALAAGQDVAVLKELRRIVLQPSAPAVLRLELVRLLYQQRVMDDEVLQVLVASSTPAPLRLIAAEALLARGESMQAVAALHELARLPNREIALATADVVQRRLNIDMGLPRNESLPAVHTRLAADVARRLLAWSTRQEIDAEEAEPASMDDRGWRSLSEM